MSSHREAPEISKDPVADSTDVYAFVSPDTPNAVTIIANYVPLQNPAGGPNFYEFGDDVQYRIHIDNDGDGLSNVIYDFRFHTTLQTPNSFLYNTGPINSLTSTNWNRKQFYSVTREDAGQGTSKVLATNLSCPPCNIGPLSTPNYGALATAAVHDLPNGRKVFAGQRSEGFYVDLGAIFDLGTLRPFQNLHLPKIVPSAAGVNATKDLNVHTIAIQVPIDDLTHNGNVPTDPMKARSVIGVWTSARRQKVRIAADESSKEVESGPWVQVSRLGNPLVNEVVIPMSKKDYWNTQRPVNDKQFNGFLEHPELANLLPILYPGVFPNLAKLNASGKKRADLVAILHTGIPGGIVPGFQNATGSGPADMLRLNLAIPPAKSPNALGLLGGDPAGFPNGRRVFDDVVTIELRAVAGLTFALVDKTFTPDAAASAVTQGLVPNTNYLNSFPYLGVPKDGYHTPAA
jgi:hypothetical protein